MTPDTLTSVTGGPWIALGVGIAAIMGYLTINILFLMRT